MVAGLALFPAWGRHADLVGNAKILKFTSFLIPLVPLFWAFARNPLQLVLVEFFGGIVWGGFNLCATNFVYDAVTPSKRVRCLGYFNLITSVSLFAGASLGGFLAERLPAAPGGSRLVPLFLLSAALRLAADLFLSRGFREVRSGRRKVKSARLFLSVVGARPLTGQNVEWEIFPTLKKFVPRGSKKPAEASA
jgi:MFS family permease